MINEDDVKAIFAHNHQLVGKISPVKLKKKEPKRKSATPKPRKSTTLDKSCHSNTITQYIRESSTIEVENDEPEGPTNFEDLKKVIEQEEEQKKKDEKTKLRRITQDSWSNDSWDDVPPSLDSEKPATTFPPHPEVPKQVIAKKTQSSKKTVLQERKPTASPHINAAKVRFQPQITSTPKEILKQKDVPMKINQSADVISDISLSSVAVLEALQNSQHPSNDVSESLFPTVETPEKEKIHSTLKDNDETLKQPQQPSNIVLESPCPVVSSKNVVDDWEDDSLFDDFSTPKKTVGTPESKTSVKNYSKLFNHFFTNPSFQ